MILYRPVSLQELELIYDSGMKAFPASVPQQPVFYPVLQLEYARQVASEWTVKGGQSAGYVTWFKVEDDYIAQFEEHPVGGTPFEEFWIPAEEMPEFNRHILGRIRVVDAFFEDGFQGFIPGKFGMQGKHAVEQFSLLANSYLYKRMDFYLELQRNHKAVFLNYPFWQTFEFKNPGLKAKVLQAIKEAWLTSFPHIPLMNPVHEHSSSLAQSGSEPPVSALEEDEPEEQTDFRPLGNASPQDVTPFRPTGPGSTIESVDEDVTPVEQGGSRLSVDPVRDQPALPAQRDHYAQGIRLGLEGRYAEAIEELSRALENDPDDAVAHTSLGVAFYRLGEADRALAAYETALRIDPIHAEAHYFRSNILYNQGDAREAMAGYTIAIGLQPELIEAHLQPPPEDRLTDYSPSPAGMRSIAKPAGRILDLDAALEADPGQAHLFQERAEAYYRLRNYARAIMDYSSALELLPDDASLLHMRGVTYEQLGQTDRAREDYRRALAIDPQLWNDYINRGVAFGNEGNFRQSIASFTEAIRLAPERPDGYFNRGVAYLQQGDLERAIEDFATVIQLSPGDEAAYYWRGVSSEEAGRRDEASADYRRFLALSRDEDTRREVEAKLLRWDRPDRSDLSRRLTAPDDSQRTGQFQPEKPPEGHDLHSLLVALGERALRSTWLLSGVDCSGEKAEDLHAYSDQNKPIEGADLLALASGIRQVKQGDFQASDPGAASPWIFIRAWEGSGFYIETDDPQTERQLKAHFQAVEEVEGVPPPYKGLFIRT